MAATISEYIGVMPESDFELTEIVETGISTNALALLKFKGLTFSEISEIVISPRTLKHRKSRGENLSHDESDRVVRVARVLAQAQNVFGDYAKGLVWLRTADDRLAGRNPLSLLQTEAGGRLVESMLWQVDEGVYS